jgi:ABC-type glucose/galactose transport system permease subunit
MDPIDIAVAEQVLSLINTAISAELKVSPVVAQFAASLHTFVLAAQAKGATSLSTGDISTFLQAQATAAQAAIDAIVPAAVPAPTPAPAVESPAIAAAFAPGTIAPHPAA